MELSDEILNKFKAHYENVSYRDLFEDTKQKNMKEYKENFQQTQEAPIDSESQPNP